MTAQFKERCRSLDKFEWNLQTRHFSREWTCGCTIEENIEALAQEINDTDGEIYTACIKDKHTKFVFKSSRNRAIQKLELICSDIYEPTEEISWGGVWFMLTLIDISAQGRPLSAQKEK
jgi:hypothetical protein